VEIINFQDSQTAVAAVHAVVYMMHLSLMHLSKSLAAYLSLNLGLFQVMFVLFGIVCPKPLLGLW